MLDGYQPGDPMVRVFTYQADPAGRTAKEIADEAFDTFNDHPRDPGGADLACAYYGRRLRSLSRRRRRGRRADGEVRLAVAKFGWTPVPGPLTEVRTSEHGTRPLPLPGSAPGSRPAPEKENHGE